MLRETYKGRKLVVKKGREWGTLHSFVNGQLSGTPFGVGAGAERRELESLRRWVDFADERRLTDPDAFPSYWYDGAPEMEPLETLDHVGCLLGTRGGSHTRECLERMFPESDAGETPWEECGCGLVHTRPCLLAPVHG